MIWIPNQGTLPLTLTLISSRLIRSLLGLRRILGGLLHGLLRRRRMHRHLIDGRLCGRSRLLGCRGMRTCLVGGSLCIGRIVVAIAVRSCGISAEVGYT